MATIDDEFLGSDLGDERLDARMLAIAPALARDPELSFPEALGDGAALEGAYRFFGNPAVAPGAILRPHLLASAARVQAHKRVLVVHDTTKFVPTGNEPRDGIGVDGCFYGHFSLAVSADGRREPLGLLALKTWTRLKKKGFRTTHVRKKEPDLESLRWLEQAIEAEAMVSGPELIHVEDREGDIYDSLRQRRDRGMHFIVRGQAKRTVDVDDEARNILEHMRQQPRLLKRQVTLSRRTVRENRRWSYQSREGRQATLAIAACAIELRRPARADESLPPTLALNAVHVIEVDLAEDEEAVEWLLLTTEPTGTSAEIEFVVDSYRARWTIEEYFKALKSGCAYESRQLGTYDGMLRALSIFAVIAWRLLLMRTLARDGTRVAASTILSATELQVLQAQGLVDETIRGALTAIAALGGHLKNNGDPGWEVIWRGFRTLRIMASGFLLGAAKK